MPATNRQGHSQPDAAKAGSSPAGSTKAEDDLHARLEPLVAGLGFDLEELRVTRVGRRTLVKVVVDADGGLELDDVAEVSRAVDAHLDADDPFSGPFVLEVSSPGVDRPLTEPRHWRRNVGRLVEVKVDVTRDAAPLTARIISADDSGVTFDAAGASVTAGYAQLGPGRVQIEFNRPASAGVDAPEG
jgi:ribosome maturation factor RimP